MTEATQSMPALKAQLFGLRWAAEYLFRFSARTVLRRSYRRTPDAVIDEYEQSRRAYLQRFMADDVPLNTYLTSDSDDAVGTRCVQIVGGRLSVNGLTEATQRIQTQLIQAIASYHPSSVIEFGCGTGRNLLAIKRANPDVRCIGLELSPASVELANAAGRHYRLEIEIHQADVTKPIDIIDRAQVCFSVHALEQIPDPRSAFDEMYRLSEEAVLLFEPIVELYGWTPRDVAARIRARHLDRLRGLETYIRQKGLRVGVARMLADATNALNPTAELHVLH